jgi:hypothetical protein
MNMEGQQQQEMRAVQRRRLAGSSVQQQCSCSGPPQMAQTCSSCLGSWGCIIWQCQWRAMLLLLLLLLLGLAAGVAVPTQRWKQQKQMQQPTSYQCPVLRSTAALQQQRQQQVDQWGRQQCAI